MFTGGFLSTNNTVIDGATITSDVLLTGSNCSFTNCIFKAKILVRGVVNGLTIRNFTRLGNGNLVDLSTISVSYRTSGYVLQNLMIDTGMMDGGQVLQGNFGTYGINNWIKTATVKNVTRTGVSGAFLSAAMIFDYDIYQNTTIYTTTPTNDGDFGVYNINGGNGKIHDNYRSGGWGWFVRGFNCSVIGDPRDSLYYNNISVNQNEYGHVDMRAEPASSITGATDLCMPCNIRAFNNTGGNYKEIKLNTNGYSNAVVLVANVAPGVEAEVRNNLSFNVVTKGYQGQQIGSNSNVGVFGGVTIAKQSNNRYFDTYQLAGLADDVQCRLLLGSAAIDAGISTSFVTNDIEGISRPQGSAYDVGAREFRVSDPIPPTVRTAIAYSFDIHGKLTFLYDDGTKS